MSSLSNVSLVKRTAGLLGILAASVAVALPVAAQMKPEAPSADPMTPADTVTPVDSVAPTNTVPAAPTGASEIAPNSGEANQAPETPASDLTSPTSESPNTPAPRVAATSGNIVDVASASDSFKTLVSALTEAELAEVLEGEGPFTVFAPTDAAFAALPAGTLEELMKPENRATLVQILKYHVVPGAYASSDLTSGEVPTAAGESVSVEVNEGSVKVNNANVIQPDIPASNGVIHAIDRVILPPGM